MNLEQVKESLSKIQSVNNFIPDGAKVTKEVQVYIVSGDKLRPVKQVYKDDAPFGNLNAVLIIPDEETEVHRPPLF